MPAKEPTVGAVNAAAAEVLERLEAQLTGFPPIACFANDWNTDPTSKHHVMRTLGRFIDVLWVESSGMRRPSLTSSADLGRIVSKARKALGGLRPVADSKVWVLSPPAVPLPGVALISQLNALLYGLSTRRSLRRMKVRGKPLLWVYTPTVARYLDRLPRSGLVYHCVDRWWEFDDLDGAEMRACHDILCREADIVFASARPLYEDCEPLARRTVLVPHGVEWEHFASSALTELPRPADLPADSRPILGFFGLLQSWVDLPLLRRLAERFPECHVVVIGRSMVDLGELQGLPNLHLLGQKAYADLPAYCRAFDVGLIPFVLNELTDAVNPIKLREYLSAGLPVVSTAMPEVVALGQVPGLAVVRTHDEFIEACGRFLATRRGLEERRVAANSFAGEGWAGRCLSMVSDARAALGISC